MNELYCGIDIHRKKYVGCIMTKQGKIVSEREFPSTKEATKNFLCGLPIKAIAIEACAMWRGTMKLLRELGYEVKLSCAKKTKDIAGKKKTDKVDAKILADLLRTGFLPEVYVPSEEILQLRDLTRHKARLTRMKSNVKSTVKCYLLREGTVYSDKLWTIAGLKWLEELSDPNILNWLQLYQTLQTEEKEVMSRIRQKSKHMRQTKLLMTMPGIADYSALLILAEIADINRFKRPKELVMYAGLCPGVYQTGDTEIRVKNNAVNKWLKWILSECSGRASMFDHRFMQYYSKIKQQKGFKVARRSTARKMLTIIWHMLHKDEPYRYAT